MARLKALRTKAAKITARRGHFMRWSLHHGESTSLYIGVCKRCEMQVTCNLRPGPNDIDISGEALALNCPVGPRGATMARVKFTRGGELKHDYTGAHVAYVRNGVRYLGTIVGVYRDEDETLTFRVRHFNGEVAPDVPAGLVHVLERHEE